ncbi:14032_t:CDS:2 [Funneliformis geosporum]|uniref:14319_t:CDS:1 n=1 Tax=Funneliformis geosporum TaxID=1117311 RepID=A0A9W4WQW8_9GLOM|nr:14032_t:CDS:2 [Funneliformis geosporum]CAI2172241.1 14319_t:CDS:2 [Funneliformis geosporum]
MFIRTSTLLSRTLLRNSTKFHSKTIYSNKVISNFSNKGFQNNNFHQAARKNISPLSIPFRSKYKMNDTILTQQRPEVNESLLHYQSNNGSSNSLNARQYVTRNGCEQEEIKRWSWTWWKEFTIILTVFAITGSTTVRIVRPIVTHVFGIEGGFIDGPWSYRLAYLSITLPLYSIILLVVGTIFRRQNYFKRIVLRMWGRFIPNRLTKIKGGDGLV